MYFNLKNFILFENHDFLVLNKPSGIAVHSGKSSNKSNNFINMYCLNTLMDKNKRKYNLLHRLDLKASGCVLYSKSERFLRSITKHNTIISTYYCIVVGLLKKFLYIDVPIKKTFFLYSKKFEKFYYNTVTYVQPVLYIANRYTLVKVIPFSGRKHQIRIHLSHVCFPVVGDDRYGNAFINEYFLKIGLSRLFLHKSNISFLFLRKSYLVQAPYDEFFQLFLSYLK